MQITKSIPTYILPAIVLSFFMVTCSWFATNLIVSDLKIVYDLHNGAASDLISVVQLGFMVGTFVFAFLNITDTLSPRLFFLINAICASFLNLLILFWADSFWNLMLLRFLTGICMGGIYPAAIKTTASWFDKKVLGKAMGFTVGALALGTAFPQLLKYLGTTLNYIQVIYVVAGLAFLGGVLMFVFVPNGPFLKKASKFSFQNIIQVIRVVEYRKSVYGYFGHMWELFAFWQFVPMYLVYYVKMTEYSFSVPLVSYIVIAFGFVGCVVGGMLSVKSGSKKVAIVNLIASGVLCLISPFFTQIPVYIFIPLMLLWGWMVLGDSPQFSTLVSNALPPHLIGTGITIMTCIGYTISILSIQLLKFLYPYITTDYIFTLLFFGPLIGYFSLTKTSK